MYWQRYRWKLLGLNYPLSERVLAMEENEQDRDGQFISNLKLCNKSHNNKSNIKLLNNREELRPRITGLYTCQNDKVYGLFTNCLVPKYVGELLTRSYPGTLSQDGLWQLERAKLLTNISYGRNAYTMGLYRKYGYFKYIQQSKPSEYL